MHVPWQAMNSIKKRHQRCYACWSLGFNFSTIESRWPDRTSVLLTVGKMFLMRQNAGENHPHGPMAPWHGIVCLAGQGCDSCAPAALSVVSAVAHTKPFSEFGLWLTKSWPWKIEIVCMPSRHPGSQSATFNEYWHFQFVLTVNRINGQTVLAWADEKGSSMNRNLIRILPICNLLALLWEWQMCPQRYATVSAYRLEIPLLMHWQDTLECRQ